MLSKICHIIPILAAKIIDEASSSAKADIKDKRLSESKA